MKAAVCFFGITRNFQHGSLESIEQCLLAPLARLDAGYKKFGHFNLVPKISNPRAGEQDLAVEAGEFQLLNCDAVALTDQATLDDGSLKIDELREFGDSWNNNFSSLRNLLRQLHSLNRVTELLLQADQPFDLVVFSRADLRFQYPVAIPRLRSDTLYTPWFAKHGGLNDRFALGDFATMVKYGRRLSLVRQYCEETGRPMHSEQFLLWYAQKQGLRTADLTGIEFCRVRANGAVAPEDFSFKAKFNHRLRRVKRKLLGPFRRKAKALARRD